MQNQAMQEPQAVPVPMISRETSQTRGSKQPGWFQGLERPLFSLGAVIVFFAAWEIVGTSGMVNPLFISAPSKIAFAAMKMFNDPAIGNDIYVSTQEFVLGFVGAILIGIPFGLLMGWYRRFNYVFDPFVSALNATPRVALTPLLIIWLGIGIWSKVALVFLGAFFPVVINTETGVRALDELLLRAARSFGARDRQIFRTIALPGSIPFILAGIRVGLGRALVGIVVGELVGATAGIGYQMAISAATFQTDRLFVGLFMITGFGVIVTNIVNRLERRFDAWRPQRG